MSPSIFSAMKMFDKMGDTITSVVVRRLSNAALKEKKKLEVLFIYYNIRLVYHRIQILHIRRFYTLEAQELIKLF